MPNPTVQRYINILKKENLPFLKDDMKIVSGRTVLTVSPNIIADFVHSFRLEFPVDYSVDDLPYALVLLSVVFESDLEPLSRLIPKIGPAMKANKKVSERIGQWQVQTFLEGENWVLSIVAMPP